MYCDFGIRNGFMKTDLYIIRYFLCFCSSIFKGIICGDCCIIIYCMCSHAYIINGFAGLYFQIFVHTVYNSQS